MAIYKRLAEIIDVMRVRQWYKNLVIFIPVIFIGDLFLYKNFLSVFLGFVSLCLISSSNYIINDIIDFKKDRMNPEKTKRPIASGKINKLSAFLIAFLLLSFSLIIAVDLGMIFFFLVISLFLLTLIYSLFLKNEIFLDIFAISINFVIRAASGAFIINAPITPGFVGGVFFLSLFLSTSKRASEVMILEGKGHAHRKTLKYYSPQILNSLIIITSTSLIIAYLFFSLQSLYKNLVYTAPIFIYTVFRYIYLIYTESEIPRHPELIYKDKYLFFSMILLIIIAAFLIYF